MWSLPRWTRTELETACLQDTTTTLPSPEFVAFFEIKRMNEKEVQRPMSEMKLPGHVRSQDSNESPILFLHTQVCAFRLQISKEKVIRPSTIPLLSVFYCILLYSCFVEIGNQHMVYVEIPN